MILVILLGLFIGASAGLGWDRLTNRKPNEELTRRDALRMWLGWVAVTFLILAYKRNKDLPE